MSTTDTTTTSWRQFLAGRGALIAVIAALHVLAWGVLLALVVPAHYVVGAQTFGIGLGLTAYTLGLRHAFDADHIAAIDNISRKFIAEGRRPDSVGFWFALGHSAIVVVLALLVSGGSQWVTTVTSDDSSTHETLGLVGSGLSGLFLYLIAALNLVALIGIARTWRAARRGQFDERALEAELNSRGLFSRFLAPLMRAVSRPAHMFPLGLLFGLGFDTATEVLLLVLAGNSAASGLPWYAVLVLPLLFASGMTLLDTADSAFMNMAYKWAYSRPVRKIFYNLTITGLSVAVAALIGTAKLIGLLHEQLGLTDPVTGWIAELDMNTLGFAIVGLFLVVWVAALAYWKLTKIDEPSARAGESSPESA